MTDPAVREAIERTSAAIAADPAKAKAKNVPATARLTEGLKCEVTGPHGERFVTDMPPAMGGTASGPNPAWLLRSAMASCAATVIAMRAAKLGVTLETLLGLDDSISAGPGAIRTRIRIGGKAKSDALRGIVAWADAHSPVGCTVRHAPPCSVEIEVV